MARVEITFGSAGNRTEEGASVPILKAGSARTEVLTSGASSVATSTSSTEAKGFGFAQVWSDADVWVVVGPSPIAAVPAPGQVLAGLRVDAKVPSGLSLAPGDRIAVINI